MEDEATSHFLEDLGQQIDELAIAASGKSDASKDAFDLGVAMGLYEVVSLMCSQADSFGISRSDVGLEGVDPERLPNRS